MAGLEDVLVVAPDVVRRSTDADGAVFWWPGTGREVRVGRTSARLLALFALPTAVSAVAVEVGADQTRSDVLLGAVDALRELGLLRPYGEPSVAVRTGLFGLPVTDLAGALRGSAHGVVVGVPYDAGVTYRAGARFGPEYLRRVSTGLFRAGFRDGRPVGMLDPVTGRRVLDGVALVDIGDLTGVAPARNGPMLADLADTVEAVAAADRVPVVLGGDHSITLPVVTGLTRVHDRLGVLHLDAHHDYGQVRVGDRADAHHGNFLDWVVGLGEVACVAQFGIRQLTAEPPQRSPKLLGWPGRSALDVPVDEVVAALPPGLRWHVTIDVDVLDPSVLSSTGTLLPGGFGHAEAVGLVDGLCRRLDVVGLDVVELIGSASDAPGIVVADLLLRALDAVFARGRS